FLDKRDITRIDKKTTPLTHLAPRFQHTIHKIMVRGNARKPRRGGGKSFSKNLSRLDDDGNPIAEETPSTWSRRGDNEDGSDDESGSDESGSDQSSEQEAGPSDHQKVAKEDVATIEIENPNRSQKTTMKASDIGKSDKDMSRREREVIDAAAAKERYWKLHQEGKTDQAKADLARLAIVRKQREEAAARRKVHDAEKKLESQAKLEKSGKKFK
ncbi:heat- and acid-stable phosphoprotein, partial [Neolecta irregularis DAH-3]